MHQIFRLTSLLLNCSYTCAPCNGVGIVAVSEHCSLWNIERNKDILTCLERRTKKIKLVLTGHLACSSSTAKRMGACRWPS